MEDIFNRVADMLRPQRVIDNIEWDYNGKSRGDFENAFIQSADCNGVPMTEDEIDELSTGDYYDNWIQSLL